MDVIELLSCKPTEVAHFSEFGTHSVREAVVAGGLQVPVELRLG